MLLLADIPMCVHLWVCVFLSGLLIILWPLIIGIRLYSYLPRYNIKTLDSLFSDFSLLNILNNLEKLFYLLLLREGLLIILKRGFNINSCFRRKVTL